ncbi:hypothetical protein AB1Y20_009782 [Prymnesium parvum]|uniref:JmjC domain-containing protein n=1 Tax=Prymnesium parvum TaxID=97485 RepID=A0AB34K1C8_PRYPA
MKYSVALAAGAVAAVLLGIAVLPRPIHDTQLVREVRDVFLAAPRLPPLVPRQWDPSELSTATTPQRFFTRDPERARLPLHWTRTHLADRGGGGVLPTMQQGASEFVLARGQETDYERSRTVRRVNATFRQFWGPSTNSSVLSYHTGPLSAWPSDLRAEVGQIDRDFSVHDAPADIRRDRWPASSANVWAGHAGVLATTHFDTSHNFVVQVFGTKRWLLWPPSELPALRLHPSSHPSRRQTRMQLLRRGVNGSRLADGYSRCPAHHEVMGPGDVLYVPPFWAHAVFTEEVGLSLSILSPSWLEAAWARASWYELPFNQLQDSATDRMLAAGVFISTLLPKCQALKGTTPRAFLHRDVHWARHAPISANEDVACSTHYASAELAQCREVLGGDRQRDFIHLIEETSSKVAAVLDREEGSHSFDAAVGRELLAGYVDQLANWAVGEEQMGAFLCCISESLPRSLSINQCPSMCHGTIQALFSWYVLCD